MHSISAKAFEDLLHKLFPLCRSITGNANRKTLQIIQEIVPITVLEIPSGTKAFDWEIPYEWNPTEAWLKKPDGEVIANFSENNLHLVSYSKSYKGFLEWDQLKSHLHIHPELEDAIPYRTSYYKEDWGFCLTHAQYQSLGDSGGPIEVHIDTDLRAGSMSLGEYVIPGQSSREILISCYICHPSMANDSLSGVVLTTFLAKWLGERRNRKWTYRIVFVPETIGAIAYCSHHKEKMVEIDQALVITTVGGPGWFGLKKSYDRKHSINALALEVLREKGLDFVEYPFDIHGSDERQYSCQPFNINAITISRDKYYEYQEYHTSLDNLSFVKGGQIKDTFDLYCNLIEKIEQQEIYRRTIDACEPMLSRYDLYPTEGGAQNPAKTAMPKLELHLWILFLTDGKRDLHYISRELDMPLRDIQAACYELVERGLLEMV